MENSSRVFDGPVAGAWAAAPPLPGAAGSAYVEWMRARQREAHRHEAVIAQRHAQADQSEAPEVHSQERAWAERHAHERRLHASALAHLRHG
jgi:hypothetical protein